MRYETTIKAVIEREQKDFDLAIEFTVPTYTPHVSKTYFRRHSEYAEWPWEEGEWFWTLCPPRLYKQLDKEMLCAWNAEHGLTVERQAVHA